MNMVYLNHLRLLFLYQISLCKVLISCSVKEFSTVTNNKNLVLVQITLIQIIFTSTIVDLALVKYLHILYYVENYLKEVI